jgi:hypothetical protein
MPTRRNVDTLPPTGPLITALRRGVRTMKGRPASDPTSWRFQAKIHGTWDTPAHPTWNRCQHGSFLFLSWHRMYLYFFERILRDASGGDPNFALPYWDWTTQRALPRPFRQPADASNPLFVPAPGRARRMNAGRKLRRPDVQTGQAMRFPNFSSPKGSGLSFGGQMVTQPIHQAQRPVFGQLEASPHNVIHGKVGGRGGGPHNPNEALMGWPETAALDPIFWLHHANIDRLWKVWLRRSESGPNPVDNSFWMERQFTFFDKNGARKSMSGQDILNTVTQLDYRYDDDPPGLVSVRVPFFAIREVEPAPAAHSNDEVDRTMLGESVGGGEEMIELGAAPKRVALQLRDEATERVAAVARAEVVPLEERIVLNVEGVQFDDQNPGVAYEVYLNLPEGQEPDFQSDYYVGNFGFFGMGTHGAEAGGHGGHPADLSFDVTDVVRALRERGEWREGEATVSFVMSGLEPPEEEEEEQAEGAAEGFAAEQEEEEEPPGRPRIERVTITTGP